MRAIMAMVGGTRHDSVLASAAVLRLGVAEAIHHTRHRQAFGRPLAELGAMTGVLADLALEYEGAVAGALRLSRAVEEEAGGDPEAAAFRRIAAPVLKYWVCKRTPAHAAEALECLGGRVTWRAPGCPGPTGKRRCRPSGTGRETCRRSTSSGR